MKVTKCPKCGRRFDSLAQKTRHHIKPKSLFPGSYEIIYICRDCHNDLHQIIPVRERREESYYYSIINKFVGYNLVNYHR